MSWFAMEKSDVLVHEWIGRNARVTKSSSREMEGLFGKVVDETKNTLVLEGPDGKEKVIPKKSCEFEIEFGAGNWAKIDGKSVCYAPEERPKRLSRKR